MKSKTLTMAICVFIFTLPTLATAQYQVTGMLDLVLRNLSSEDASNKTFKGFSNFDYVRARLFFDAQPSEKVSVFTQVLVNNSEFQLYGAYVRLSKIGGANVNLHAGLIPNTVGLWGPRAYSDKNPLIGQPLMYLYHTALSPTQYQTTNEQLFAMRGEGYDHYGLPIIYDPCWNTGLEVFGSAGMLDWSVGALSGSVSAPRIQPEKDVPQLTGKLGLYFSPVFSLSFSGFAGPYMDDASIFFSAEETEYSKLTAVNLSHETKDYLNLGGGFGAHYDYGMLEMYSEAFFARWEHPVFENLDVYSAYFDARYKLAPQWFVAGRIETMRFSEHDFGETIGKQDWDYPLNRFELGVGYRIDQSVLLKVITQIVRGVDDAPLDDETIAIQLSTTIH
ncbi:MAG: hypothetical protein WBP29_12165 [Candidatus Zixiibacteriota bacterium]